MSEYSKNEKDKHRADRLKWSNQAEHKLKQELNQIALEKCREFVENFVLCSKENGMLVVFKCRSENKKVNECLKSITNKKAFEVYKEKRQSELLEKL